MHLAEEGQQVVFAEREDFNVLYDHHLVVIFVEERPMQDLRRILSIALGQEGHRLLHAPGRGQQARAVWILAQAA